MFGCFCFSTFHQGSIVINDHFLFLGCFQGSPAKIWCKKTSNALAHSVFQPRGVMAPSPGRPGRGRTPVPSPAPPRLHGETEESLGPRHYLIARDSLAPRTPALQQTQPRSHGGGPHSPGRDREAPPAFSIAGRALHALRSPGRPTRSRVAWNAGQPVPTSSAFLSHKTFLRQTAPSRPHQQMMLRPEGGAVSRLIFLGR